MVVRISRSSWYLRGQCASSAALERVADRGKTDRAANATIEFVTAFYRARHSLLSRCGGEAVGDEC